MKTTVSITRATESGEDIFKPGNVLELIPMIPSYGESPTVVIVLRSNPQRDCFNAVPMTDRGVGAAWVPRDSFYKDPSMWALLGTINLTTE